MRYVVTFFGRDEKGRRQYLFPQQRYIAQNARGEMVWQYRFPSESIFKMMTWFEETPLSKMMASYGIGWAFTDLAPSSISINVKADDSDILDEMLVSLKLFAGRDVRFRKSETFSPRRRENENVSTVRDPYARV